MDGDNQNIEVGDVVMVVKPSLCPYNPNRFMGYIFTVDAFELNRNIENNYCANCGDVHYRDSEIMVKDSSTIFYFAIFRLKKLPPIGELDKIILEEELKT